MIFSFKKFIRSFQCAFHGLKYAFLKEQTFRIQIIIALVVIALMFYFNVSPLEKVILLAMIFLVLSLELVNTTAEKILDIVEPNSRPKVRIIKDTMAAAVLVSAFGALIIGLIIFLPYLSK